MHRAPANNIDMDSELKTKVKQLMWAGGVDELREIAPCSCCCADHTNAYCPARLWEGCRSGLPYGEDEHSEAQKWADHYAKYHDMNKESFYKLKWDYE